MVARASARAATRRAEAEWHERAACREHDPCLWYPEKETQLQVGEAKGVCAGCPVQAACLADALDRREPYGVWGGMTTSEREYMLKMRMLRGVS